MHLLIQVGSGAKTFFQQIIQLIGPKTQIAYKGFKFFSIKIKINLTLNAAVLDGSRVLQNQCKNASEELVSTWSDIPYEFDSIAIDFYGAMLIATNLSFLVNEIF